MAMPVVVEADNIAPAALGALAMDVNSAETKLVVGRANGSIAIYKIDSGASQQQNIQLSMVASTGGKVGTTISGVRFLGARGEESHVAVSFLSGQIVLYDVSTVTPVDIVNRKGGSVYGIAKAAESLTGDCCDLFAACGDGCVRQYAFSLTASQQRRSSPALATLTCVHTFAKVSNADRAIAVAAAPMITESCEATTTRKRGDHIPSSFLVVASDDGGNVVACAASPSSQHGGANDRRHTGQTDNSRLWCSSLPNGSLALSVALDTAAGVVCVGTTASEVLFLSCEGGVVARNFSHHKGPVSAVAVCPSTSSAGDRSGSGFFASGWHDSLRSYRYDGLVSATAIYPSQVKRRTHYHECTSLCVAQKKEIIFSASVDGTVMHGNLRTIFTAPPRYVDSQICRQPFVLRGNHLVTLREQQVEIFELDLERRRTMAPLASFAIEGDYHIRGVWANGSSSTEPLATLCVATDVSVTFLSVSFRGARMLLQRVRDDLSICGVAAVAMGDGMAYVAANRSVHYFALPPSPSEQEAARSSSPPSRRAVGLKRRREEDEGAALNSDQQQVRCFSSPLLSGAIADMVYCREGDATAPALFVSGTTSCHFLRLTRVEGVGLVPTNGDVTAEALQCLNVTVISQDASVAVGENIDRQKHKKGDEVCFWSCTDRRQYLYRPPVAIDPTKPVGDGSVALPVRKPRVLAQAGVLPPSSQFLGRLSADGGRNLSYATNGLQLFGPDSWEWIDKKKADDQRRRPLADGVKEGPVQVAPKLDFAAPLCSGCADATAPTVPKLLLLYRNIECALDAMPPAWRTPRFGN